MQKFVIDTSVLVRGYLENNSKEKFDALMEEAARKNIVLYAPPLIWFEFYSVMAKMCTTKEEAFSLLKLCEENIELGLITIVNDDITELAYSIAFTATSGKIGHIGPFDAYFHALALHLGATFLTNDKKHYNKTYSSVGAITLFDDWVTQN